MDRLRRKRLILFIALLKKKYSRDCWVRSIFQKRNIQGDGANLMEEMRLSDKDSFFNHFRVTHRQFDDILRRVGPRIQKMDTNYRESISVKDRLAITVRYLASGDLMVSIARSFRVGRSTVSLIIRNVCEAIAEEFGPIVLPTPTLEMWKEIAADFSTCWQFPNCIGALDGKHIEIQAPKDSGSDYFNYKGYFSIVLLAVCDAHYRFTVVDIGSAGRDSDGGIFQHSALGKAMQEKSLNVLGWKLIPGTKYVLPHVLVTDESFPLKENLMRPYPACSLGLQERVFNYRLSRARRCIENAFGILSSRFRILRRPLNTSLETSCSIVKAIVCLHNYLRTIEIKSSASERKYCPPDYSNTVCSDGRIAEGQWRQTGASLRSVGRTGSNNPKKAAKNIRDLYKDFFMIQGSVNWQISHVLQV